MNKFKQLMIDLETMGNKPDSAIVAIAAVPFDMVSGVTDDALFYEVIDLRSSEKYGGSIDADTVLWWLGKSENARGKITNGTKMIDLHASLTRLNSFSSEFCEERVQVWGNGSNFDNVILRTAYESCEITPFWKHWNDRDVRTIVELGRNAGINPKKDFPFVGEAHNALDDALHQVNYVVAIHQHLLKNF
ncbi:3'-5' exoribonuclease [Morganella sp. GD04133]|uniref:3'-5' exonuclease n=1 Tax=Morganella sp. GD04133 TaxID=2975435 RepID=UPI00244A7696|nr:3'-5' exoribonuclease [Morganella sp. GD04133]MDH0354992.1 3'-5' exoribonuclease [Morganella sp. GD04133]